MARLYKQFSTELLLFQGYCSGIPYFWNLPRYTLSNGSCTHPSTAHVRSRDQVPTSNSEPRLGQLGAIQLAHRSVPRVENSGAFQSGNRAGDTTPYAIKVNFGLVARDTMIRNVGVIWAAWRIPTSSLHVHVMEGCRAKLRKGDLKDVVGDYSWSGSSWTLEVYIVP